MSFKFNNIFPKHFKFNDLRVGTLMYNNNVVWQEGLPSNYTTLEYIASTGSQYIDTGFIPNQNTGFEIEFLSNDKISSTTNEFGSILGSREKSSVNEIQLTTYTTKDSGDEGTLRFGSSSYNANISTGEKNVVSLRNREYISNGNKQTFEGEFTSPSTLTLFALNQNGTITQHGSVRIYSFKLYNGNKLIRDFVPCCNSSGVAGLYDLVLGKFYTNQGEGDFVKSYNLPSEYQQVEYIEGTGTQHFEIDFIPNSNTSSKGKYQITDESQGRVLFGSRTNSAQNFYGFNWGGGTPYKYYNSFYTGGLVANAFVDEEVHTFEKKKRELYVDDILINTHTYSSEWQSNLKLIVFACNTAGTIALWAFARLFYLQVFDGDRLAIDLIPCYRKSDGEIGMYDLANGVFYTNEGTGTFLKGNNI